MLFIFCLFLIVFWCVGVTKGWHRWGGATVILYSLAFFISIPHLILLGAFGKSNEKYDAEKMKKEITLTLKIQDEIDSNDRRGRKRLELV